MKRGTKFLSDKKGLSPIIATILLIFLVLVIASIVFLWALGFFTEQLEKNGESVENQCQKINLRIEKIGDKIGRKVELELANDGNIAVQAISIKEIAGGNEHVNTYPISLGKGDAKIEEIDLEEGNAEEIIVYPVLIGSVVGGDENKKYTCIEKPTRIIMKG